MGSNLLPDLTNSISLALSFISVFRDGRIVGLLARPHVEVNNDVDSTSLGLRDGPVHTSEGVVSPRAIGILDSSEREGKTDDVETNVGELVKVCSSKPVFSPSLDKRPSLFGTESILESSKRESVGRSRFVRNTTHPVFKDEPATNVGTAEDHLVAVRVDNFGAASLEVARRDGANSSGGRDGRRGSRSGTPIKVRCSSSGSSSGTPRVGGGLIPSLRRRSGLPGVRRCAGGVPRIRLRSSLPGVRRGASRVPSAGLRGGLPRVGSRGGSRRPGVGTCGSGPPLGTGVDSSLGRPLI